MEHLSGVPSNVDIINTLKDMHRRSSHNGRTARCMEGCDGMWPCRTYAYADNLLARRFEDLDE